MIATALLALLAAGEAQVDSAPLIPAFFTGERLYEICSRPNAGQCSMYVAGVLDGVFEAETRANSRSICGADLSNREAAERVVSYLRENASVHDKAAAVVVKLALRSDLECGQETAQAEG